MLLNIYNRIVVSGFESVQLLFFVGNNEQYAFIQTIHVCCQKWKTISDKKVPIFQHKSTTACQEIFSASEMPV